MPTEKRLSACDLPEQPTDADLSHPLAGLLRHLQARYTNNSRTPRHGALGDDVVSALHAEAQACVDGSAPALAHGDPETSTGQERAGLTLDGAGLTALLEAMASHPGRHTPSADVFAERLYFGEVPLTVEAVRPPLAHTEATMAPLMCPGAPSPTQPGQRRRRLPREVRVVRIESARVAARSSGATPCPDEEG